MTNEKAIMYLESWQIDLSRYSLQFEVFEKAIKALKVESYKKETGYGWIPVSERLPDAGDTYIVTIEYKGKFEGVDAADCVLTDDGYIDGKWNTWNDWIEGPATLYHVTAWMPLPDPYKAEMEV